ncbi:MAG: hypothetical protein JSV31_08865 [Desulfobacterales bacterium]|nr:MAG: hypothetical protein JSV31_08865 [Desulfobacterales bacterium]
MRPRRIYYNNTSFLDLLFNTLVGFVLLFIIAFLLINPSIKKADIKTKAEFVITVTWNDNSQDDVDTWLQDPAGNVLHFRQKDVGLAHLDRDDLGKINDIITLDDGRRIEYTHNQELTTIRGFVTGEWVLNVHMYNKRDSNPTLVEVRIDKLNPKVQTLFYKKIVMKSKWEEVTVTRFVMTNQGDIISWDDLPKKLLKQASLQTDAGGAG